MTARLAIAVALAACAAATAHAADVQVCDAAATPPCFPTIQEAVDAAYDGDTVLIPLGLYEETVVLDHRTLTLEGGQPGGIETRADLTGGALGPPLVILGGEISMLRLALRPTITRALEISDGATVTGDDLVMVAGTGVETDGGLVHATDSTVSFSGCTLEGGRAIRNGGVLYASGGRLTLTGSVEAPMTVSGGHAGSAGGLVHADDLIIEETLLESGEAELGGAVSVQDGGSAEIRGAWQVNPLTRLAILRGNTATWGGGVYVGPGASLSVTQVYAEDTAGGLLYLGANAALDAIGIQASDVDGPILTGSGSARSLDDGAPSRISESSFCGVTALSNLFYGANVEISNSFVIDSTSEASIASGDLTLTHNHIVGNTVPKVLDVFGGTFLYNLVAHNAAPSTIVVQGTALVRRNLWWDNQSLDDLGGGSVDLDPVYGDPVLRETEREGCTELPKMYPSWYGAARGALVVDGVYTGKGLPMPGVWGGLDAPLMYVENGEPAVADAWAITGDSDADQVVNFYDCARIDGEIYPGAADVPYDGIDSDCLGDDDFDADGDGERSSAHDPEGTDCDDTDPTRGSLQEEIEGNGKDDDCDGWADAQVGLVPRTCAVTGDPTIPFAAWLLPCILAGRRRYRAHRLGAVVPV